MGIPGAVSAASDGEFIVVVYKSGSARRYDANTGGDKGLLGSAHAVSCSLSGGVVILTYANGSARRYDVRTGGDKGLA